MVPQQHVSVEFTKSMLRMGSVITRLKQPYPENYKWHFYSNSSSIKDKVTAYQDKQEDRPFNYTFEKQLVKLNQQITI